MHPKYFFLRPQSRYSGAGPETVFSIAVVQEKTIVKNHWAYDLKDN